jgi:site-specific DNA-methyltransferase (adenine-specific)
MRVLYDDGAVTLYHGDMREVVPALARLGQRFGCCITDPPFARETHEGARTNARSRQHADGRLITFEGITVEQLRSDLAMLSSVVDRWLVSTVEFRHAARLEDAPPEGWRFIRTGVWVKPDGAPQISGDRPAQGWEAVAVLHRAVPGRMRWNGGGKRAVWTHGVERAGLVETQKPVGLIREFIRDFTDPGELLLDPYGGGATTGVSARLEGRRAVVIEQNEEKAELAARRLRDGDHAARGPAEQGSLFA